MNLRPDSLRLKPTTHYGRRIPLFDYARLLVWFIELYDPYELAFSAGLSLIAPDWTDHVSPEYEFHDIVLYPLQVCLYVIQLMCDDSLTHNEYLDDLIRQVAESIDEIIDSLCRMSYRDEYFMRLHEFIRYACKVCPDACEKLEQDLREILAQLPLNKTHDIDNCEFRRYAELELVVFALGKLN